MNPEDNENEKENEENNDEVENELSPIDTSITQSQIVCMNCRQLYTQTSEINWLSICEPCLQKTESNENSFTCCFESCKSDQHDSCPTCKKSFCSWHISFHNCEVQPVFNTNDSIADDDEILALQPKKDDGDKKIDDPDNMDVQPDVADDTQGQFRQRQDFLTSFLKTLTIEETGNCGL